MKLVLRLHNQAGVVMMHGERPDKHINVQLEDLEEYGLGITEGKMTTIHFDQPLIVTGITLEGVNE